MAINKGWFYFHRYFFALAFDYLYFRFHFSIERNKVESIMLTDFEIGFKKRWYDVVVRIIWLFIV